MKGRGRVTGNRLGLWCLGVLLWGAAGVGMAEAEFRAFWADAFHTGFRTPAQTAQMVADARRGNFNAIVVQVRKRGDAYYNSLFEPKAADVSPQSYDPLGDLIAQAHSGPEPLEVHAWVVTYNIWNQEVALPPQPGHPFRQHPDWLTRSNSGATFDGYNYAFDPAHPEVQSFTFSVAMDIVSRYDVDGIHFDYIRYTAAGASANNQPWGYHPVAVERFNRLSGRSGIPAASDAQWLSFRRDQVTALLRKVYLHTWAIKPEARVSAATILFSKPPTSASEIAFRNTEAYARVLQNWRAWMEEGILDLNIPMNYRDHDTLGADFLTWRDRVADMQFDRQAALGAGTYLNDVPDAITQFRASRTASPSGNRTFGCVGYSYAVTNNEGVSRGTFLDALTSPSAFDANPTPIFDEPTSPPAMPWKSDTSLGNLMGTVTDESGAAADGGTITVTGPVTRTALTDATGFFGFVGLPVGTYSVEASPPPGTDLPPVHAQVEVSGAQVLAWDPVLTEIPFAIINLAYDALNGGWELTWTSQPNKTYRVEISEDSTAWSTLANNLAAPAGGGPMLYRDFTAGPDVSRRFYRVVALN